MHISNNLLCGMGMDGFVFAQHVEVLDPGQNRDVPLVSGPVAQSRPKSYFL